MHTFVTKAMVSALIAAGACMGPVSTPAAAASGRKTMPETDHSFVAALAAGNKEAVSRLLDSRFEWTNKEGNTRSKSEALAAFSSLAADNQHDSEVKMHSYSDLVIIFGRHNTSWFSRVWVRRAAGWRLFTDMDTPAPKGNRMVLPPSKPGPIGDCDNPCRTIPFKPSTAADRAAITEWQKTKVDEWHPNIKDWAKHVAREFIIINDHYGAIDKPERVALGVKWQKEGIGKPGAPVLSMKMYDFGNTVIAISRHVPYHGGKPYYNLRVFVHRNGHWPIAWSQQTTIQSAAPLT